MGVSFARIAPPRGNAGIITKEATRCVGGATIGVAAVDTDVNLPGAYVNRTCP